MSFLDWLKDPVLTESDLSEEQKARRDWSPAFNFREAQWLLAFVRDQMASHDQSKPQIPERRDLHD